MCSQKLLILKDYKNVAHAIIGINLMKLDRKDIKKRGREYYPEPGPYGDILDRAF